MQSMERPTFEYLKTLEPELGRIEAEIRAIPRRRGFNALKAWYGWGDIKNGYRGRVSHLVGWERNAMRSDPNRAPVSNKNGVLTSDQLMAWPQIPNPRFHPELCMRHAYDVAYEYLYDLLHRVADRNVSQEGK